jgi:hypothetical protein
MSPFSVSETFLSFVKTIMYRLYMSRVRWRLEGRVGVVIAASVTTDEASELGGKTRAVKNAVERLAR